MIPIILSLSYQSLEPKNPELPEGMVVVAKHLNPQEIQSDRRIRTLMFDPTELIDSHPRSGETIKEKAQFIAQYLGTAFHFLRESHASNRLPNPNALRPTATLLTDEEGEVCAIWMKLPAPPRALDKDAVDRFMSSVIVPALMGLDLTPHPFQTMSQSWSDLLDQDLDKLFESEAQKTAQELAHEGLMATLPLDQLEAQKNIKNPPSVKTLKIEPPLKKSLVNQFNYPSASRLTMLSDLSDNVLRMALSNQAKKSDTSSPLLHRQKKTL